MTTNNSINAPLPISSPNGGTGLVSPTIHGFLIAQGTGAMVSSVLGAGQVHIGTTAGDAVPGTIIAGANIIVTAASGTLTIAATGGGLLNWTDVTGTSQAMVVNSAYTANNASLVTLTLPATAAYGSEFAIAYKGAGGWKLAQNSGQTVRQGTAITTSGAGGSIASTLAGDSIRVLCTTADTGFEILWGTGNWTIT